MISGNRPLSPHLQIYRPQLTSILSILHRLTGVVLAIGTLLLTWWVVAIAAGPEAHAAVNGFMAHWFGRMLLLGWSFCLFYHLCNGIRHLVWDAGLGFELKTVNATGWAVVAASVAMTLVAWLAGYGFAGGAV